MVGAATGRYILLVDDDADVRESIASVLEEEGFPVATASNGRDALSLLRSAGSAAGPPALPVLILLDLMMPVMSGYELRAELRRDPQLAKIPVVVLTGDTRAVNTTLEASALLRKPISLDDLLTVVNRVR